MNTIQKLLLSYFILFFMVSSLRSQNTVREELFKAGDAIRLQIWNSWESSNDKNPVTNLSNDYVIDTNGNILMPFVGLIRVVDRTPEEVAMMVKERYKNFLANPFIYIRPLIRVTLVGSVAHPGTYRIDPKSSLWDLFEQAGGPLSNADFQQMFVMRGGKKVIKNLLNAFEQAYSLSDAKIQTGDQIFVPESSHFNIAALIGYVNFGVSVALLYLRLQDKGF